ncbi:MLP-like protein 28 [Quillaja saponaria]|uniref:MLP-like protein 28 n=1 Tax=Quillaja saponaria TaxID=32244 RepID=A0AAD7LBN0_QUISA|nr:MLP-like protein 28 [Quillaja saponaria]
MSKFDKVETDVHIKASPEKFREMWSSRIHHTPNISPGYIQGAVLHEGEGAVWALSSSGIIQLMGSQQLLRR